MDDIDFSDTGGVTKPEYMRKAVKQEKTLGETIAQLKANSFQYASAGDAKRLIAEIDRCHARLEIDHAFRGRKMERFEIPYDDRLRFPDGIDARDETIKLLDENIDRLRAPHA